MLPALDRRYQAVACTVVEIVSHVGIGLVPVGGAGVSDGCCCAYFFITILMTGMGVPAGKLCITPSALRARIGLVSGITA